MRATIDELKEHGFKLCEHCGAYHVEYMFTVSEGKLYVSDYVFGENKYEVKNSLQVLFDVATGMREVNVKLDGIEFTVAKGSTLTVL